MHNSPHYSHAAIYKRTSTRDTTCINDQCKSVKTLHLQMSFALIGTCWLILAFRISEKILVTVVLYMERSYIFPCASMPCMTIVHPVLNAYVRNCSYVGMCKKRGRGRDRDTETQLKWCIGPVICWPLALQIREPTHFAISHVAPWDPQSWFHKTLLRNMSTGRRVIWSLEGQLSINVRNILKKKQDQSKEHLLLL